jgi:sterol desaturase/sphingolipid hydroxylase (fatty acid hydroxylase superfamily)
MEVQQPTVEELLRAIGRELWELALGEAGRLSPVFLVAMLAICLWLYVRQKPGTGFFAWVFPRSVYFHRSHWVDVKIFLFTRLLNLAVAVSRVGVATGVGAIVSGSVGEMVRGSAAAGSTGMAVLVALLSFVVVDFSAYWVHRIHHENRILWPFHAVHHSAEVMTPITLYRKHPVYDFLGGITASAMLGFVMGVLLGVFVGGVSPYTIGGINMAYYIFHLVGSNLRHSHIWLSYGPVLEHILISPAQHQVHHSVDVRHHDKNYGEVLAIWDWMFGTLYVPRGREQLTFGLADARGNRLPQQHPTLRHLLFRPFADSWAALRETFGRRGRVTGGARPEPRLSAPEGE